MNGGFETDVVGVNKYLALTPGSWTSFSNGTNYVVEGAALGGITSAYKGQRYYLAHAPGSGYSAIRQESKAIAWSSLSVGDTLTVSAWTTYRNDVSGAADTYFWLNDSDASGLKSPPIAVTDAAPAAWTRREWSYVVTRELLDKAIAGNWGQVEVQVGIVWKTGELHQQVAFDDVSLTHIPAAKTPISVTKTPVLVTKSNVKSNSGFNRDIRPILSENCFFCHGQDPKHRGGKLRLDLREEAVAVRDGIAAFVPGNPEKSEMIRRLLSKDPEMVPPLFPFPYRLSSVFSALSEKQIPSNGVDVCSAATDDAACCGSYRACP